MSTARHYPGMSARPADPQLPADNSGAEPLPSKPDGTASDGPKWQPGDVARLVEQYQAGIWRYLRSIGCDPTEADDLTQDTFLAVLRRPFQVYNSSATAGYLRRVAHNLFISHRRRQGRVVCTDQLEQIDRCWERISPFDQGEELLEALRDCLGRLTDRARTALEMRFRDRASRAEIAEFLQITEHGAKNLMQRAKKQLRSCVEGKIR